METSALDLERERERQYCELCGKMENLLKCGRCRNSFYCSKEHQKQHWKKHKLICREADGTRLRQQQQPPSPPANAAEPERPKQKNRAAEPPPSGDPMKGFITSAETPAVIDGSGGDGCGTGTATKPNGQNRSTPQKLAAEYIVPCMNKHGICVVDNFLGAETGACILGDVKALRETGRFTDGQLVSQKSDSTKDIRGDQITWVDGQEPGCEKIRFLMSRMDDLVRHCNGKLENYAINGRTKPFI
ncbi:Egl nine 1 [Merluccius polli]|uniref:Egl nine 1 n=1 Tax=Merluccius polli TaxID=89951 RepID=A0AA47P4F6_MERPO|nr:Egl nine 1 [Merluccius polli]